MASDTDGDYNNGSTLLPEQHMDTLLQHQQINDLLIRYGCALDERDWTGLGQVFTEQARVDYGSLGIFEGRDAVVAVAREFIESCGATQHLIGNVRIETDADNPDSARTRCYVQATHASRQPDQSGLMTLWGEYRDQLVRQGDGWAITARSLVIQHIHGDIGVALKGAGH
ncbi:nuclear transport factor 2 family protein [Halopseudomonas bauzanensis]|uniref:Nuclear transport factor 2 family protein n=2 Tax=Halopseudomonas bauzanensis TaxID=653930 RepID=A0A4U0YNL3_9GAMM|nr:nuclear transport factor 2 family protein [Halopseudomonas bauzanensis]